MLVAPFEHKNCVYFNPFTLRSDEPFTSEHKYPYSPYWSLYIP